jgi:hypothetical protein
MPEVMEATQDGPPIDVEPPARVRRRAGRYEGDVLPSAAPDFGDASSAPYPHADGVKIRPFRTKADEHGVYRIYPNEPSYVPDLNTAVEELCNAPGLQHTARVNRPWYSAYGLGQVPNNDAPSPFIGIFTNSVRMVLDWWYGSSGRSQKSLQGLFDIFGDPDFKVEECQNVNVAATLKKFSASDLYKTESGWKQASVEIPLPAARVKVAEGDAPTLTIPGVWYRSLKSIIVDTFTGSDFKDIHLTPFERRWEATADRADERVRTDIYNSDEMIAEHVRLQKKHNDKGGKKEIVVAAVMAWSDATHLAQFGTASLWPMYTAFGNISKYIRGKPSTFCLNHTAYIPKVRSVTTSAWCTLTHG